MSIKRVVDTQFWEDATVIERYSVEDKYFLLYLMTNPHSAQVGIYKLPKKIISFETGYTVDSVSVILERFENKYKNVLYDNDTHEISVINSLKYSIVKGGKPVGDLLIKELNKIDSDFLVEETYNHLLKFWDKSDRIFDETVKLIFEDELSKRKEPKETNDNDNDNDNEESYHDSSWAKPKSVINVGTKPLLADGQTKMKVGKNRQTKINVGKDGQMSGQNNKKNPKKPKVLSESGQKSGQNDQDEPKMPTNTQLEDFKKLWNLYPRKKHRDRAYKAYKKAIKDGTTNKQIQDGIINLKKEIAYKGTEMSFIPYGSTWFNGKCWEDEYEIGNVEQSNDYKTNEITRLENELQDEKLDPIERNFMSKKLAELKGSA